MNDIKISLKYTDGRDYSFTGNILEISCNSMPHIFTLYRKNETDDDKTQYVISWKTVVVASESYNFSSVQTFEFKEELADYILWNKFYDMRDIFLFFHRLEILPDDAWQIYIRCMLSASDEAKAREDFFKIIRSRYFDKD